MSRVSAWKSCDFSISMNFFSMLSILVARLSTFYYAISNFSILFSIPSIEDVTQERVALISFKVSSCCCCSSVSWLFRFIILFWFCDSTVFFLLNNGHYWICISVEVKFTDFSFCNDGWEDWFGFWIQFSLINCYTPAILEYEV